MIADGELTCVVIAAGRGSRMSARPRSKPLVEVGGKALIDWVIDAGCEAGVSRFLVVTGFAAEELERHLAAKGAEEGVPIETVHNAEWEKGNGLSVLKAAGLAGERFLLVMADHIVDPSLLQGLRHQAVDKDGIILAVDFRVTGHPYVDMADVTRVQTDDGRIAAIGKNIPEFDAFDTGVFFCTPAVFSALDESRRLGDDSLSGGIRVLARGGKTRVWDIGERFWIDIDDEVALRKAEEAVGQGLDPEGDPFRRSGRRRNAARALSSWTGIRVLLSGAGLLLFIYLLLKIGLGTVLGHLARFGPWFFLILALSFVWVFLQTLAWRFILTAHFKPVPLSWLFRTKIISDALNAIIPSASVGGDTVRAFLIRKHSPIEEGIPGVLVDKTIEFSASILFLMGGFLVSLLALDLPRWMNAAALACLTLTVLGIVLLVAVQVKGSTWILARVSRLFPRARRLAESWESRARRLDRNLRQVYRKPGPKAFLAGGLHFLARLLGAAEVFVILKVLGAGASFLQSIFMATGVTIVNTAFFLVPGHFGIMESAHVIVAQSLGLTAAIGLSLGIIRRIRKLAATAVGLLLFALKR